MGEMTANRTTTEESHRGDDRRQRRHERARKGRWGRHETNAVLQVSTPRGEGRASTRRRGDAKARVTSLDTSWPRERRKSSRTQTRKTEKAARQKKNKRKTKRDGT